MDDVIAKTVVLRFVGEPSHFVLTAKVPTVGDVLTHGGEQWEVVDVRDIEGNITVTLRPAEPVAQSPAPEHV